MDRMGGARAGGRLFPVRAFFVTLLDVAQCATSHKATYKHQAPQYNTTAPATLGPSLNHAPSPGHRWYLRVTTHMSPQNKNKWSLDLTLREQDVGYDSLQKLPPPPGLRKVGALESKIQSEGLGAAGSRSASKDAQIIAQRKKAKAMSVAMSPGRQIAMNGFMMYMSGKNLNIFSISICSMAILSPLKGIFGISKTFKPFEDPDGRVDLQMAKLIHIALNLAWLCVGLYKMATMRLLPTTSADWAGAVVWKELMESSSIPP